MSYGNRERNLLMFHAFQKKAVLAAALVGFGLLGSVSTVEGQATAPYQRTIIVSPVPGNSLASGAALRAAVASVSPTAASPWLIKLEPGIYDLGKDPLVLKRRLDIEGSGTEITTVTGAGQDVLDRSKGVLIGADKMEVRNLKLTCVATADRPFCIAMANVDVSPKLTDLKIVANQAFSGNWGLRNSGSSPVLDRVQLTIAHGTNNYGIVNGRATGESRPTIRRSLILAKGGSASNIGILDKESSSPLLVEDTEVTAFGGFTAAAMQNLGSFNSPVTLRRVSYLAYSATNTFGVDARSTDFVIEHSRIEALGSSGVGYGSPSYPFGDAKIDHSIVKGPSYSVVGNDVNIKMTTLGTGSVLAFTAQCSAVIDGAGTFQAGICP